MISTYSIGLEYEPWGRLFLSPAFSSENRRALETARTRATTLAQLPPSGFFRHCSDILKAPVSRRTFGRLLGLVVAGLKGGLNGGLGTSTEEFSYRFKYWVWKFRGPDLDHTKVSLKELLGVDRVNKHLERLATYLKTANPDVLHPGDWGCISDVRDFITGDATRTTKLSQAEIAEIKRHFHFERLGLTKANLAKIQRAMSIAETKLAAARPNAANNATRTDPATPNNLLCYKPAFGGDALCDWFLEHNREWTATIDGDPKGQPHDDLDPERGD